MKNANLYCFAVGCFLLGWFMRRRRLGEEADPVMRLRLAGAL